MPEIPCQRRFLPSYFQALTVAFFFCLLLLFAMPQSLAAKEPIVVGFAQDHLANDWRLAQVKELEKALAPHHHIRFIYTDAGGSTAKQIRDIEDMIHGGVDILITSPRDSETMTPVISQAYQQGIHVILLTREILNDNYTCLISPDDGRIARDAANYLARELVQQGRILILQGVPTASTSQQRTEAFIDELNRYPGISIAAIKIGNYLRNDAIRAMEEVLAEEVVFDAIYAQSDSMASGARMVLSHSNINPADIPIIGIDYISEAREAIRQGEQRASFTYPTGATQAADVVLALAAGRQVARHIVVPSQRVDASNVEQIEPIF